MKEGGRAARSAEKILPEDLYCHVLTTDNEMAEHTLFEYSASSSAIENTTAPGIRFLQQIVLGPQTNKMKAANQS